MPLIRQPPGRLLEPLVTAPRGPALVEDDACVHGGSLCNGCLRAVDQRQRVIDRKRVNPRDQVNIVLAMREGPRRANLTDTQTWICSFAMLLGRLEIFTLMVVLTPAFWRK